jgi:hypothetical protein
MNQELEQEVIAVEQQYMSEQKPFTALDIGNALKEKGINVRQRDVSPVVRDHFTNSDMYVNAGYTRTLIPVKDGIVQAFLYFHIDNTPDDYTDTNQDPLPWDPNKPIVSDNTIDDTVDSNTSNADPHDDATDDQGDDSSSTTQQITLQNNGGYVGSKRSTIFHSPDCMYADRITQANLKTFDDLAEAVAANYRACKIE